jgi:hypothetical protein
MEDSHQLHAPTALIPRREPQYLLDRRLSGSQSRSGRCEEDTKLSLAGYRISAAQPASSYRVENRVMVRIFGYERGEVTRG